MISREWVNALCPSFNFEQSRFPTEENTIFLAWEGTGPKNLPFFTSLKIRKSPPLETNSGKKATTLLDPLL